MGQKNGKAHSDTEQLQPQLLLFPPTLKKRELKLKESQRLQLQLITTFSAYSFTPRMLCGYFTVFLQIGTEENISMSLIIKFISKRRSEEERHEDYKDSTLGKKLWSIFFFFFFFDFLAVVWFRCERCGGRRLILNTKRKSDP